MRLIVLIRLASRLNRTRSPRVRPPLDFQVEGSKVSIGFPEGWLEKRPLTQADLEREAAYLLEVGFEFEWS